MNDEEFAILEMLDGEVSLEQLKHEFQRQFAPQRIEFEELSTVLADFHRYGLTYSDAPGQGQQLAIRDRQRVRRAWIARLTHPFSVQFDGINPQRILDRAHRCCFWLFSPWSVAAAGGVILAALAMVTVKFDEFYAKLPGFHQFFTLESGFWLLLVLGAIKVVHEFAHGLTCRHFGGECREIGLMFLMFAPCLYCDVSDAWMIRNKWHRMAISAAGMFVELTLAAVALFVWWFSTPGFVHYLALQIVFVCSVTTLVFNLNPLMRFDGYYILSDYLEIPNLSQQASMALGRCASKGLLGIDVPEDFLLPRGRQLWFAAYAIAAPVYRGIVAISIVWFLHDFFEPYRLQIFTYTLAFASLLSLLIQPLWRTAQYLQCQSRSGQIEPWRAKGLAVTVATLAAAVFLVPLPHRVYGTFELEPHDPQNVYVEVPGELIELHVQPGESVDAGTVLADLESIDLDVAIAELEAKRDAYQIQLASARRRRFKDPSVASEVPELEEVVVAYEEQLVQRQRDRERLVLIAEWAGTVMPAPEHPKRTSDSELSEWSGSLFEPRNHRCYCVEGTLLCQIGDPEHFNALIVVEQSDLPFIQAGQQVDIKLDELPEETFSGSIDEISRVDMKVSPPHLSNKQGGELPTKTDEAGTERPLTVSYQARAAFRADACDLRTGFRGRARIYTPWQSLAARVWWWASGTLHFRW